MPNNTTRLVSLVVSCFNEESVVEKFYAEFLRLRPSFLSDVELIFVNDGSTDGTLEILWKIAGGDKSVKIVSFSRNFGHEAAMIAGIDAAGGDGVVCMDADLQHPLEAVPQIIEKLDDGFDIIGMVRKSNKSAGLAKNITSKAFYSLINFLSKQTRFESNASDFFAVSRRAADVLRTNYRERNRFLRGFVQSLGFKKTTLEYVAANRAGGASHYSMKRLFSFAINSIVCFSDIPLKLGIYAGFLSGMCGIALLIYTLATREGAPSGYATIVVLLCFFFSILFFLLGILGEYVATIFAEIKARPIYIVEERVNFKAEK